MNELAEINEIQNYIFIQMASGHGIVIPKQKIDHLDELVALLKQLANQQGINYNIDLNWKWK